MARQLEVLRKDHGEELSEKMKIAALLQMSPIDVRDLAGQIIDGGARYEQVRDRMKTNVTNRMAMEKRPAAMEVGALEDEYEEYEAVGAVGNRGACYEWGDRALGAEVCAEGRKEGELQGRQGQRACRVDARERQVGDHRRQGRAAGVCAGFREHRQRQGQGEGPAPVQWPVPLQ